MSALTDARDHARQMATYGLKDDAALWTHIADEIDAHLEPDEPVADDGPGLFGEGS